MACKQRKEPVRLVLPGEFGPECLRGEWHGEVHQQESNVLTFWDTFEWGLWFGGHALYSCGEVYHLCSRQEGWLGPVVCVEQAGSRRRFRALSRELSHFKLPPLRLPDDC